MAKKNIKAATTVAALSPEEFLKLTPEEQAKYLQAAADAQNGNLELKSALDSASTENKKLKASIKTDPKLRVLPIVEDVEADEENDITAGDYQFTCPTFHWDDNTIINVFELMEAAQGKDKKKVAEATVIIAKLLQRKSGILVRIVEEEKEEE